MQLIKSLNAVKMAKTSTPMSVMISNDPDMLRAKAHDLCQGMRIKPEPWCSRYPVMGNNEVQSDHEWVMTLSNGIGFIIEEVNRFLTPALKPTRLRRSRLAVVRRSKGHPEIPIW